MKFEESVMRITEILKKEYVLEELKAKNKRDVLAELTGVFVRAGISKEPDAMVSVLLDREKLGSTGIGDGIAIPHGKIGGLDEMVIAFGRSREGIEFDAMDSKPVHLFFLLMAPEQSSGQHLKALAKISRMLKDGAFRKALLEAPAHEDLFRVIVEKDEEV